MPGVRRSVEITDVEVVKGKYAVYHVAVEVEGKVWSVARRFSEFHALAMRLRDSFASFDVLSYFPGKTLRRRLASDYLERRRVLLEAYLRAVCSHDGSFFFF